MRKRMLLLVTAIMLPSVPAFSQAGAVTAPILEGIMSATHADQLIYYAQSIMQMVQNATNTYNQFQNLLRAEQMAVANLKGIAGVKSFDDFMTWYNRQLYLDQQAEKRFTNMGVKIGGKTYKLADIEDIPKALGTEYIDYWNREFTPDQRRQMWVKLGMSPSNYAYVQTWKAREEELGKKLLTKKDAVNEDNMAAAERENEMLKKLEEDAKLPEDQRMGEKAIAQMNLQASLEANRIARDAAYDRAEADEQRLAREKAAVLLPNQPDLPNTWGQPMFEPLSP